MAVFTRPPARSTETPESLAASDLVLVIDRIACDGYGTCAELLPELIELDDWGYPIIRPGPIPPQLLDHAQRAVDACPVLALRIVARPRATMAPKPGAPGPTRGDGRRAIGGNGG